MAKTQDQLARLEVEKAVDLAWHRITRPLDPCWDLAPASCSLVALAGSSLAMPWRPERVTHK